MRKHLMLAAALLLAVTPAAYAACIDPNAVVLDTTELDVLFFGLDASVPILARAWCFVLSRCSSSQFCFKIFFFNSQHLELNMVIISQ